MNAPPRSFKREILDDATGLRAAGRQPPPTSPSPDGHAELVIAFMSRRTWDAEAAVRETARVLEPGGRLCLGVTNAPEKAVTEERQRRRQRPPVFLHVRALRP